MQEEGIDPYWVAKRLKALGGEAQTGTKALDLIFKLTDLYAPERSEIQVDIDAETQEVVQVILETLGHEQAIKVAEALETRRKKGEQAREAEPATGLPLVSGTNRQGQRGSGNSL